MEKINQRESEKNQIQNAIFKKAYYEFIENENNKIKFTEEESPIQNKDLIREVLHDLENKEIIKGLVIGLYSSNSYPYIPTDKLFLQYERENNLRTVHIVYKDILEIICDHKEYFVLNLEEINKTSPFSFKQIEILIKSIYHLVYTNPSYGKHVIPEGIKSISDFGKELLLFMKTEENLIQNQEFLNIFNSFLEDHSFKIHDYSSFKDGHIGWVFKGFNLLDERYAIKIYKKPLEIGKEDEYHREPTSLMKLDHPNIVKYKIHFLFPYYDKKYLILIEEFIEGKTLQDSIFLLKEEDLRVKIEFILKILDVLAHFKSTLSLHGDLTLTNILVRENYVPVVIDPGFSIQRFISPNQIINDEKLFIVDLLGKILTSSEKKIIELNLITEIDSLSEFQSFFKNAEHKVIEQQKLDKIQSERNQVKKFYNYMVNVFSFRYSMKKFDEISKLYHPNQFTRINELELKEITQIHEKIRNMYTIMNDQTDREIEKIGNDKDINWHIINRHFDYPRLERLKSDYRDVYTNGFAQIIQKLIKVTNFLEEPINRNILVIYFRKQLEALQKHNKFKLVALPLIRNSIGDPIFQIVHKYYKGSKTHDEINKISLTSRMSNEIKLKLQYKCDFPEMDRDTTISILLPDNIELSNSETDMISKPYHLSYKHSMIDFLEISLKRMFRFEPFPMIIKIDSDLDSVISFQIITMDLKKFEVRVQ